MIWYDVRAIGEFGTTYVGTQVRNGTETGVDSVQSTGSAVLTFSARLRLIGQGSSAPDFFADILLMFTEAGHSMLTSSTTCR